MLTMKYMQVSETVDFSAVVRREGKLYVALCPEVDVASQGKSVEEALKNLKEALELYLEDEDVEKPSKVEAPIVTIVKVTTNESARNLRSKSS
ncbi:MAG TPA: type II toxin-antitoxin system HicB family antitoxin [Candidatus Sulfotelmatobacter sp.]|nr:type II toxin-antitoxin system HicB family antitoxin [Candidatus Sulfotelmatobacter sp.]